MLTDKERQLLKAEREFREGINIFEQGCPRPHEDNAKQIGWDAANEMKRIKAEYLIKARQEYGGERAIIN